MGAHRRRSRLSSATPKRPDGAPPPSAGTTPTAASTPTLSQNCYWTNHDMFDGLMAQNAPFWTNVYTPLQQVVREMKSPARADRDLCTYDVRHRYQTHNDLQDHALQLLHTDQADFVFLHFAIPHSPNIWSRIHDDYTQFCDSSYLDNLALADRVLGRIVSDTANPRRAGTTPPSSSKATTAGASMPGTGFLHGPRRTTQPRAASSTNAPPCSSTSPARASRGRLQASGR